MTATAAPAPAATNDADPYLGPRYPLGVDVSETTPEAPSPTPELTLFMLVTENDVANRGDGGRLLLQSIERGQNAGYVQEESGPRRSVILGANLVLSVAADSFLLQYPWKGRSGKEQRVYVVTVREGTWADVPPDPDKQPVAVPVARTARELLAEARLAAVREGNTTLATEIEAQLTPSVSV